MNLPEPTLNPPVSPYDRPGKDLARRIVMDLAHETKPKTILDLWGGGRSARAFREVVPDAIVTSADHDMTQWPALRLDAQQHGYAHFFGDVEDVEGTYDLIWLDFMGQASAGMRAALERVARKVERSNGTWHLMPRVYTGWLAVTILPARESDGLFAGDDRLLFLGQWLQRATGLGVRMVYPYRRTGNLPMWLVLLNGTVGHGSGWFDTAPSPFPSDLGQAPFDIVMQSIEEDGYWSIGVDLSTAMWDELDAAHG